MDDEGAGRDERHAVSALRFIRELRPHATLEEILEISKTITVEQLNAIQRLDTLRRQDDDGQGNAEDLVADPSDERIYSSAGLTLAQHHELEDEWQERANTWLRTNRLRVEEELVQQVILPQAIREQWKVGEDKLARLAAAMAIFAVDLMLGVERSQVRFAADAGVSRRAWQKTWDPRFEDLPSRVVDIYTREVT